MKTFSIKQSEIEKNWILADAEGKILGRFAPKLPNFLKASTSQLTRRIWIWVTVLL